MMRIVVAIIGGLRLDPQQKLANLRPFNYYRLGVLVGEGMEEGSALPEGGSVQKTGKSLVGNQI